MKEIVPRGRGEAEICLCGSATEYDFKFIDLIFSVDHVHLERLFHMRKVPETV